MLPPSSNAIYAPVNLGRRGQSIMLKKEAVKWIEQAALFLPPCKIPKDQPLREELEYHADWYTKAGEIERRDVRNYEKLVTDTVFRRYNLDDKLIFQSLVTKVQNAKQEYVIVKLYAIERSAA